MQIPYLLFLLLILFLLFDHSNPPICFFCFFYFFYPLSAFSAFFTPLSAFSPFSTPHLLFLHLLPPICFFCFFCFSYRAEKSDLTRLSGTPSEFFWRGRFIWHLSSTFSAELAKIWVLDHIYVHLAAFLVRNLSNSVSLATSEFGTC